MPAYIEAIDKGHQLARHLPDESRWVFLHTVEEKIGGQPKQVILLDDGKLHLIAAFDGHTTRETTPVVGEPVTGGVVGDQRYMEPTVVPVQRSGFTVYIT